MIQKHAEENYSDRHADFIMRQAEARLWFIRDMDERRINSGMESIVGMWYSVTGG